MATTTAPLLSFGASGQIAKTQVYSKWKGRSYVRRHVVPANPQSVEQTKTRGVFSFLQNVYKFAPALATDVWTSYANGKVMTSRNAFTKFNLADLRAASALTNITLSPGANGGPPPASQTPTPGSGTITNVVVAPATAPVGWTLTSAISAVIKDQDPHTGVLYVVKALEDTTTPYSNAFTGLAAGVWQVRSWLKWTRADGTIAYSPDIATVATVT